MNRRLWVSLVCVFLLAAPLAYAQEVSRLEIFGGYSYLRYNSSQGTNGNFHGWNASAQLNGTRALSVVADFNGTYSRDSRVTSSVHSYLFGPRLTAHAGRASIFGHLLIGGARAGARASGLSTSDKSFAMAMGGGVDLSTSRHLSLRPLQADYLMTLFNARIQNNARISTGLVFHW